MILRLLCVDFVSCGYTQSEIPCNILKLYSAMNAVQWNETNHHIIGVFDNVFLAWKRTIFRQDNTISHSIVTRRRNVNKTLLENAVCWASDCLHGLFFDGCLCLSVCLTLMESYIISSNLFFGDPSYSRRLALVQFRCKSYIAQVAYATPDADHLPHRLRIASAIYRGHGKGQRLELTSCRGRPLYLVGVTINRRTMAGY